MMTEGTKGLGETRIRPVLDARSRTLAATDANPAAPGDAAGFLPVALASLFRSAAPDIDLEP